ncbi:deazaflavin-dependent oxidoreductase (nitroreductase family) [Tamaricihabitans halophyticus]|uniref:Deazaflavin-dependent oxidoreductase (Nitroreductase family) n=1 Tax=Tamaricihabitans halophyticus TaxID=1262583 RepID=A0A4R2R2S9_9PSEU|nr:nitroreductase/quinone reductase family protein [Tamaricihabitans halophyticus]TCP57070.1 deazaflavin-dependent oxidoreductase (nitroreductase family) [Tamaricihabitans halophyticus]
MAIDFNQQIIDEFRANKGRVGGPFEGARLLLLTTTGARTGGKHTTPLGYLPDENDRVLVIGSAGGAPNHPDWFHNVLANPQVTVETGLYSYQANAVEVTGAERDRLFARAVEADPGWAEYQANTNRAIPVVALDPVHAGPPVSGGSFGEMLRGIHDVFRREIELVRAEVARSGPGIGAQLRVNCLNLCKGLEFHHTAEDAGMFPNLAVRFPELEPTLARLRAEHEVIAKLLDELQRVIMADGPERAQVLGEVDRLAAELHEHLRYEEEQLIPLLDG